MRASELTGHALNWAVAKCEGYEIVRMRGNEITFLDRTDDGALNEKQIGYSTDWAQGGPIIEREGINLVHQGDAHGWVASLWNYAEQDWHLHTEGTTPLIAAMRCYVASKLGEEVEIPTELTQGENK